MTYLVLDVETSGLPEPAGFARLYPPHEIRYYSGSRIIEIACIEYDENGRQLSQLSTRVCPEGPWTMNPEAQKIHGINKCDLADDIPGVVTSTVMLSMLQRLFENAHMRSDQESPIIVGHNVNFDWHVVSSEAFRLGNIALFEMLCQLHCHCTMRTTTELCGLMRSNGRAKWPTLTELHSHLFDEVPAKMHAALSDVQATARCFFWVEFKKNIVKAALDGSNVLTSKHIRSTKPNRRRPHLRE